MPTRCTSGALWAIDRVSAQMIAGRTGVPAPSSRTAPIIWPEKPTPSMRDASHSAAPSSRRVASHTACHQASGSCSALPPGPKSVSYLVVTAPSTRPSASTKVALSPVVPRSWEMIIVCDLLGGTGRRPSPYRADMSEPTFSDTIRSHYETYIDNEDTRLRGGMGRLELARVQEIVRRNLPQRPLRVLDVGGGDRRARGVVAGGPAHGAPGGPGGGPGGARDRAARRDRRLQLRGGRRPGPSGR